jgi:uncharacterized membrane protein YbjE (DUF340 family)
LISKFLFTEELFSKHESQSRKDYILQYNKQNIILINSNNNIGYNQNRSKNKNAKEKSDQDIFIMLFMGLFIGLILVGLYLKYQTQINILLVSTLFITSTSLSAIYYITKRRINIDKHFKLNLIWIVVAAIFVPIILYYSSNPFYLNNINNINNKQILNVMETQGCGALLTEYGFNTFSF